MFELSKELSKYKTTVIVLSCLSLFISLSMELPSKIIIIGIDLTSNKSLLGWFIWAGTFYVGLKFFVYAFLEVVEHKLPSIISKNQENTCGNTLGLTEQEIYNQELSTEQLDIGTISGEKKEIQANKLLSKNKTEYKYALACCSLKFFFEIGVPSILWFTSLLRLYQFLSVL